jgi:hypothetical protein
MLLDDLVDELLVLDGHGHVQHFYGNYSEYIAQQQAPPPLPVADPPRREVSSARSKPEAKAPRDKSKPKPKSTGKGSALSKLNQSTLEQKIVKLEAQLADLDQQLADPDIYRDGAKVRDLQTRRQRCADELEPLEAEWIHRAEP